MSRSTRMLITLSVVAGILGLCAIGQAVTWSQAASYGSPYVLATPITGLPFPAGTTNFSAVGNMPSELLPVSGLVPNFKVTYQVQSPSAGTGWGPQPWGNNGLSLYVSDTPSSGGFGLFTGYNGGHTDSPNVGWLTGGIAGNVSSITGGAATAPIAANTWYNVTVTNIGGAVTTTVTDSAGAQLGDKATYTITSTDGTNWTGRSRFAAFRAQASGGTYLGRYGAASVINIVFYKDLDWTPPASGTLSGTVTMNYHTSHPAATAAQVLVSPGGATPVTNASGQYSVNLSPGTYAVTVSQANCEAATISNVVITGSNTTTVNVDLTTSFVKGKITANTPGNPAVVGASVWTTDGLASSTTDSAGNYALQVKNGSYSVKAYKVGYLGQKVNVSVGIDATATQDFLFDTGWDLAGDFNAVPLGNPNGAWSYYWDNSTSVAPMSQVGNFGWGVTSTDLYWSGQPTLGANGVDTVAFLRNIGADVTQLWSIGTGVGAQNVYRPTDKLLGRTGNYPGQRAIARFTAPTSGTFNVTGKWSAAGSTGTVGTTSNVEMLYNGYPLFGPQQLNGFVGTAANGYTDSFGTAPVLSYSIDLDLTTGETVDTVLALPAGMAQMDLTISKSTSSGSVGGHVTAGNLPGNPAVPNATITAIPGGYTTVTDSVGAYALTLGAGTYTITAGASGYNTPSANVTVSANSTKVQDFSLTHAGTWDLSNDFTTIANPNLQWTFGNTFSDHIALTPYPVCKEWDPGIIAGYYASPAGPYVWPYPVWRVSTISVEDDAWLGWIGKNLGPATTWASGGCTIDANSIAFGGGSRLAGNSSGLGTVRWTSPDQRVINLYVKIANQYVPTDTANSMNLTIMKNGRQLTVKNVKGFVGTLANGYSDSMGPSPIATYQTQLQVNAGDTIDLVQGKDNGVTGWGSTPGYPMKSFALVETISPGNGQICTSIGSLKSKAAGTAVFMTTPVALASPTYGATSGITTGGLTDQSFYIESDDRSQGMKCVTDGGLPGLAQGTKITFSGAIETEAGSNQKVIRVGAITSTSSANPLAPVGCTTKGLAASMRPLNMFVRVWGKLTQMVSNTDPTTNANWPWTSWTINDGGQDVKVLMIGQNVWMQEPSVMLNDKVGINGIASVDSTGTLIVIPTHASMVTDYGP